MQDLERDLESFALSRPPDWLRARALFAADDAVARRRHVAKLKRFFWTAVAAGAVIAALGRYFADYLAPLAEPSRPAVRASHFGNDDLVFRATGDLRGIPLDGYLYHADNKSPGEETDENSSPDDSASEDPLEGDDQ